jgi:YggT family protein
MMLILLRWFGAWLQLDTFNRKLRWAWRLTDPFIGLLRRKLPPMGPMDFAPAVALFIVFLLRLFILSLLIRI